MPSFNPVVRDNIDSVSTGRVELAVENPFNLHKGSFIWFGSQSELDTPTPHCREHKAMNKVTREGIWRCLACGAGCWEIRE